MFILRSVHLESWNFEKSVQKTLESKSKIDRIFFCFFSNIKADPPRQQPSVKKQRVNPCQSSEQSNVDYERPNHQFASSHTPEKCKNSGSSSSSSYLLNGHDSFQEVSSSFYGQHSHGHNRHQNQASKSMSLSPSPSSSSSFASSGSSSGQHHPNQPNANGQNMFVRHDQPIVRY